jgi:hypothetical protein
MNYLANKLVNIQKIQEREVWIGIQKIKFFPKFKDFFENVVYSILVRLDECKCITNNQSDINKNDNNNKYEDIE